MASTLRKVSGSTSEESSDSTSTISNTTTVSKPPSLYVFGGCWLAHCSSKRAEKLTFSSENTQAWVNLPDMPSERNYFSAAVVNRVIYVIGGRNVKRDVINSIESYDTVSGKWKTVQGIKPAFPRAEFGAATIRGKIFFIGGYADACRRVECFDVKRNEISERRSMERGRWGLGVVECRGRIYACGGQWYKYKESDEKSRRQSIVYLNDVESYDPVIDTWERESGMLRRRGYFGLAVYDDCLYAVGGMGGECNQRRNRRLDSIEKYDTYTKQWTMIQTHLDGCVSNLSAVVIQSKLLAIGGTRNRNDCDGMSGPGATFLDSIQSTDLKLKGLPVNVNAVLLAKTFPIMLTSPRHSFAAVVLSN